MRRSLLPAQNSSEEGVGKKRVKMRQNYSDVAFFCRWLGTAVAAHTHLALWSLSLTSRQRRC